ncbi:MAG: DNA polymerase/3'-5' exonuclease PolX [Candidatus Woesearchaeota archaeon]
MTKNSEIAGIFYEMADLLEMQGVQWKPRAYRNAARAVDAAEDVELILKKGGKKALMEIPGIGESIADKIIEYIDTGRIKEYEKLTGKLPEGVHAMMHIMGVGPKKAWRLYKELNIRSVDELEKACKQGKIRQLKGFGAKTEEDILKGIATLRKGQERINLGKAWLISQEIIQHLKKLKEVKVITPAGSLRRMQETIGDIDILVISVKPEIVMDTFVSMPDVVRVLARGKTKSSVQLKDGVNADVRVLEPRSFGAALQYFTGSKDHNIALRQIAIRKGLKLSEYGLFKGKKQVAGKTEEEIYKKLGLQYVEPELRQNSGEIEAARAGKLPRIIGYDSIRGDLHTHSKWSDGVNTLEEMVQAAIKMGYEYIALTDHSKSEHIAHGMEEKRLAKYIAEIEKLKKKYAGRIRVLCGSEVNIMNDGSLDYSKKLLDQLDWVVASVHSRFKSSEEEMTKRIIRAIETGQMNVLGHPTGRLIGTREPYAVNMERVIEAAKENNVALEINAFPLRLDLKDSHVRMAVEAGAKLCIGTDSHNTNHLPVMRFGIAQARRGWAEEKDVINTWKWNKLEKHISK